MKRPARIAIVLALVAAVGLTLALRSARRAAYEPPPDAAPAAVPQLPPGPPPPAAEAPPTATADPGPAAAIGRPRLLELGSNRCVSCQEMAKVLEALRASQGERLEVDFIDVFEQPEAADRHRVLMIPTQVLFDGAGREIFRHTGYFAHDDILAKFRELGVEL